MGSGAGAGGEGGGGTRYDNGNNGENGGGSLIINAEYMYIYGTLNFNGGNGGDGGDGAPAWSGGGGGGASGGGIRLIGSWIDITTSIITVNGGDGGISGSTASQKGGGGRIKIFYRFSFINTSSIVTAIGQNDGTIYYQQYNNSVPTVSSITFPSNDSRYYNNTINFTNSQSTDSDSDAITYSASGTAIDA